MGDSIKAAETRLAEIAVLKTHIINYSKTRPAYAAYRKVGYSKAFLEAHREEITLHKAAKAAFDEAGLQTTTVVPMKASGVLEKCDISAHLRRRLVPLWLTALGFSVLLTAFVNA